jgi:hypothetical protein
MLLPPINIFKKKVSVSFLKLIKSTLKAIIKYKFNSKKHRFEGEHLKGLTQTDFIDYHQIVSITDKKKIINMF